MTARFTVADLPYGMQQVRKPLASAAVTADSAYKFQKGFRAPGRDLAEQEFWVGKGLYYGVVVGQLHRLAPRCSISSAILFGLRAPRLFITTICPAHRLSTSTFCM